MNEKGFTLIELIVSFVLTSVIIIMLFQLIINLKELQEYSDVKTKLLTKQAIISSNINKELYEKTLLTVNECNDIPNYCLEFVYTDGTTSKLIVDTSNGGSVTIGKTKVKLVEDSYFGEIDADVEIMPAVADGKNDSILKINIDIHHKYFDEQNFGLYLVYQYDYQVTDIRFLNFG